MLVWQFNENGIQISVGAYHPDKVVAVVTIPYKELGQMIRGFEEFRKTGKQETQLEITKLPEDE